MSYRQKARSLWRRLRNYVRNDLREIVLPRPMPDPPDYVPPRKLTWKDYRRAITAANRQYIESWRTPKKAEAEEKAPEGSEEPGLWEDLSAAARGGSQTLGPFLRKLYASRTVAYRDAMKNFLEGYREGLSAGPVLGDWDVSQHQKPASTDDSPPAHAKGSPQSSGTKSHRQETSSNSVSEHDEPSQSSREPQKRGAPYTRGPEGPGPSSERGSAEHIPKDPSTKKDPE